MYDYQDKEIYGNVLIGNPDPFFSTIRMYNLVDDLRSTIMYSSSNNGVNWEAWADELNEKFGMLYINPDHRLTPERCRDMIMSTPLIFKAWRYNVFPETESDNLRTRALDIAMNSEDIADIRAYNFMYNSDKMNLGGTSSITVNLSNGE